MTTNERYEFSARDVAYARKMWGERAARIVRARIEAARAERETQASEARVAASEYAARTHDAYHGIEAFTPD